MQPFSVQCIETKKTRDYPTCINCELHSNLSIVNPDKSNLQNIKWNGRLAYMG